MTVSSAEIAQLVEHFTRNEGVEGSSPFFSLAEKIAEIQVFMQGFSYLCIYIIYFYSAVL